jgi:hypothetical protein
MGNVRRGCNEDLLIAPVVPFSSQLWGTHSTELYSQKYPDDVQF